MPVASLWTRFPIGQRGSFDPVLSEKSGKLLAAPRKSSAERRVLWRNFLNVAAVLLYFSPFKDRVFLFIFVCHVVEYLAWNSLEADGDIADLLLVKTKGELRWDCLCILHRKCRRHLLKVLCKWTYNVLQGHSTSKLYAKTNNTIHC